MIRFAVSALCALAFSLAQYSAADAANNRSIPRPPPTLSPDFTDPWLLQMKPGKKKPVITSPSRSASATRGGGHGLFKKAKKQRSRGVAPEFLPQIVRYTGIEAPGTIIIDTGARFLYLVLDGGKAQRYGVGVGRPGFEWAGVHTITRKAEWPDWTPPPEMIAREADRGRILPALMEGGPANPLGARALYLGETLYRIHGSNEPWTIGHAVSSGCIRMRNEDVIDLYARVDVGTRVLVQ
jgi:lipoprotein-anchoring transpeptidase ErfK/SrfK